MAAGCRLFEDENGMTSPGYVRRHEHGTVFPSSPRPLLLCARYVVTPPRINNAFTGVCR